MTTTLKRPTRAKVHPAGKLAAAVARTRTLTAGRPVAALRASLGVPRNKFARLVGRTERAVIDWETGKSHPQGLSQQRVRELERLTEALQNLFDSKVLGAWFDTPNQALGGFKPVEVIERGESDRLWRMIYELQAGAHT
jgi:DNA-binding transcriptional regulator YiaG